MGEDAFHGCASLNHITVPEAIHGIDRWCFAYCKSLVDITIPEGINFISDYAFCGCTNLGTIKLPETIQTLGHKAFSECDQLKVVYLGNPEPPRIFKDTFDDYDKYLYVPRHKAEDYRAKDLWNKFETIRGQL